MTAGLFTDVPTADEPAIDLRLGRWQDVLADVECDALICDPPYGERTHAGHDSAAAESSAGRRYVGKGSRSRADVRTRARQSLGYSALTPDDVRDVVRSWSPRVRGWICVQTCSDLAAVWREALDAAGRMTFAPLPIVDTGSRVRLTGDGPSNWTIWLVVARPRLKAFATWGTLPGTYWRSPGDERSERMGGKPLGIMRAIVRDYSRPGDLVCDPFAGHGTTLLAAAMEGRRAVGAEVDPAAHAAALRRFAGGYSVDLPGLAAEP